MREVLTTARLSLRPMIAKDIPALVRQLDDLRVSSNLGRIPHPYTEADAQEWIDRQPGNRASGEHYVYGIQRLDTGELAGAVGIHWMDRNSPTGEPMWEIGYWYGVSHWGQGFATEAGAAILTEAEATLKPDQFVSGHFTANPRSGHVLVKLGFAYTGIEKPMDCLAQGGTVPGLTMLRTAGTPLPSFAPPDPRRVP